MSVISLYDTCRQKVSQFLKDGTLTENRNDNPFRPLPSNIIRDLFTAHMTFAFFATEFQLRGMEFLMESGTLPELKLMRTDVRIYLPRLLVSLASGGCRNLEIIKLKDIEGWEEPPIRRALQRVLYYSVNLKVINCAVEFDLRSLRNCRRLESVIIRFTPAQPWYDFLDERDGRHINLNSLVLFTIKGLPSGAFYNPETPEYISTILKHCPNLASLGGLDSARSLAQLHETRSLHHVNLQFCTWSDNTYPDDYMQKDPHEDMIEFLERRANPELIRKAVIYHSLVEELALLVFSTRSIPHLSNLRNLTFLDIYTYLGSDLNLQLCNVFQDIGVKLKYVGLYFETSIDFTHLLQHSPNLEALRIKVKPSIEPLETEINLPKLKYLFLSFSENNFSVLRFFSNCHNLSELSLDGDRLDEEAMDEFLRKNSLFKLEIAFVQRCQLSQRGFCKFLRSAPELQAIDTYNNDLKRRIDAALLETNHNAKCRRIYLWTGDFFARWFSKYD